MTSDPASDLFTFLFELFAGVLGLIMMITWFIVCGQIGDLKIEARKQTRLLEEIAAQGRAPLPPTPPPPAAPSAAAYFGEEKKDSTVWVVVGIFAVAAAIIAAIAIARHS